MLSKLFSAFVLLLLLTDSPSYATTFFDDEMEQGTTGFNYQPNFDNGIFTYDTSVKFSGAGSIRANLTSNCNVSLSTQCGGTITKTYTSLAEIWRRYYIRISGTGPNTTDTGLFKTGSFSATKIMKSSSADGAGPEYNIRNWHNIGNTGGRNLILSAEHVPTYNQTTDVPFSSQTIADNRWYCIEDHQKVNTPGVADGIGEIWVDGVKVLTRLDIIWQRVGYNHRWNHLSIVRQNGWGSIWWDRVAVGDTRIGCIGSGGGGDTTPPATPSGWTLH